MRISFNYIFYDVIQLLVINKMEIISQKWMLVMNYVVKYLDSL